MIESSLNRTEAKIIEECVLALTVNCFYEHYEYFELELKHTQQDYVNIARNFPLQSRNNMIIQPEFKSALTFFAVMFDLEYVPILFAENFTVSTEDIDRLWNKFGL